jgi:predicted neuraminidase
MTLPTAILVSLLAIPSTALTEFIFETAPFASCHASTIVELRNGELMAAWFGGSGEGSPDVAIWASRRSSSKWSEPFELVREAEVACYNPVLFYSKDGRLWLYYKFGTAPSSWAGGRRYSTDDGKTWSAVEHLPAGLIGPVRAKPLVMTDGTIVAGSSWEAYRTWAVWIDRSTDDAKTWSTFGPITVSPNVQPVAAVGPVPGAVAGSADWSKISGIIQPTVVALGGNHLRFYARSTALTGKICIADSVDAGVTWTQARPIDLPNPNSGIDAVALPDGRVLLIYNHSTSGRPPLNLAVSSDGEHFKMFCTLENQPGEYSYPAMIQARNGDLLMTYTWNRRRIRFRRIALADVPR